MTSNSGDLPIHYGAKNGELSRFRELVKRYPESLSVRNGAGKLPLETALDASSFSIAAYLVINHGATVPPGLNFSNLLANSMRLKERVELPKLISLTPSEQFPRALDVYLTEARLPAYRKEMVFLALSEFMKKLGEQASTPTTTLDDESKQVIAAAKAEVEELKQTCSDLQNRNKEREAQLEKQITELSQKASEDAQSQSEQLEVEHEQQLEQLEKQIEEAQKAFSDLQEKASRQEELLALEKAKVSSVEMKQAQTEPLFQAYAEARRCEEKFLSGNHLPNTSALTSIAQSLNDRLTKLGTQRSVSQRFLSLILAQDQPDEEDLIQVVKSLSSELADIENDLLLTNNDSAHVPATNVTDEVDTPSEPAKKRARVSLSPSSHH
jgi:myosin heavy subunit